MNKVEVVFEKLAVSYKLMDKAVRAARRSRDLNALKGRVGDKILGSKVPMPNKLKNVIRSQSYKAKNLAIKRQKQDDGLGDKFKKRLSLDLRQL